MKKDKEAIPSFHQEQLRTFFLRVGFRSPSMKDIAEHLGISKKTLYKYCFNKEDLLVRFIEHVLDGYQSRINQLQHSGDTVLVQLQELIFLTSDLFQDFHQKNRHDLKQHYPTAAKVYEQFVTSNLTTAILENLTAGVDENIYRATISRDIAAQYLIKTVELIENEDLIRRSQMTNSQFFKKFVTYHFFALTTDKGRDFVKQMSEQWPKNSPNHH